jgi:Cof subfamily protein (haloacid dehalogenase superfamily)
MNNATLEHIRPPYRLLALDLDGTVVGPDFLVPPGLVAALAEFKRRGGRVTIATGRTFRTTGPYAEQLGVNAPLICYQGALIRDFYSGETLFHLPIPGKLAAEAAALLLERGIYVHGYVDDGLVVPYDGEETRYYRTFSSIQLPMTVAGDLPGYLREHPPTKLLFIAGERDVGVHVAGLQEHFVERLSISRSHAHFGELTAPGSTKGTALAWLAEHFGVPRAAVAAAGDQGNDVDMVAWSGLGMAVETAPPDLISVANVVIGKPQDNGLEQAVRQHLL